MVMPCKFLFSLPLALGAVLGLGACSSSGTPAPATGARAGAEPPPVLGSGQPPRNQCNANAPQVQALVGQPWDSQTLARVLAAAGADEARMLRPNSIVTKEYKMGRVNVVLGPDNRVQSVSCG
ncbi:MAG: I78 family peptidase inhibitor [Pseudomonadota bacterium]|nr:I78 family peptidase inhibitor [Pseudomonadota bacterium]